MSARIRLPEPLDQAPFAVAVGLAGGLGAKRLRGADLQRPYRGIRSVDLDLGVARNRCRAYAARMPADQSFSHVTAALLYGIPVPWRVGRSRGLHVAVPPDDCPPRGRGVIGHRLSEPVSSRVVTGLQVLPPVLVWCQLGALLTVNELVAAGDFLVGGQHPLATRGQLRAGAREFSGRRGARALRAAVELVRERVDSPKETELRLLLCEAGLPEPEVNIKTYGERGEYLGKPDLRYRRLRIAFEYEGDHHRTDRETFRQDLARRERFESAGWTVIRVTDYDLGEGRVAFLAMVRARIRRMEARLGA